METSRLASSVTATREESALEPMVKGANLLAHFNVRCPSCNKLYRISSKEIHSSNPHFECQACTTQFTFDFPPRMNAQIETRVVEAAKLEKLESMPATTTNQELKSCPKCLAMNPRLNAECVKCGVIFARLEGLPADAKTIKATPGLVKAWQDLMGDYGNLKKHLAFVDRCEDLQAIPFALRKYQDLKEAQPHDETVNQMLHRVLMRSMVKKTQSNPITKSVMELIEKVNWRRVQKLSPLAFGGMLILYGLMSPGARNMAGIGAAMIFLTVGFTIFLTGRIRLADLWE